MHRITQLYTLDRFFVMLEETRMCDDLHVRYNILHVYMLILYIYIKLLPYIHVKPKYM